LILPPIFRLSACAGDANPTPAKGQSGRVFESLRAG
jgi:hypothetical protein